MGTWTLTCRLIPYPFLKGTQLYGFGILAPKLTKKVYGISLQLGLLSDEVPVKVAFGIRVRPVEAFGAHQAPGTAEGRGLSAWL